MVLTGVGLTMGWESVRDRWKFKRELQDNGFLNVSGDDWYAAWQTSVEDQLVLCTEPIAMRQLGKTVKFWNKETAPENPKAGYYWEGQLQFVQGRHLLGWYFPLRSENNSSRGTIFLFYNGARKTFYGKWVGATYDGDLASGLVVISKDRSKALQQLQEIVSCHTEQVNVFANTLTRGQSSAQLPEMKLPSPPLLEAKEILESPEIASARRSLKASTAQRQSDD
jgi:hypothetical protein